MSWTQDRKDRLKTMWLDGRTSREIADTLGEITRNAVMGMVNRMGLMGSQSHNVHLKAVHGACKPKGAQTGPESTPALPDEMLPEHPPTGIVTSEEAGPDAAGVVVIERPEPVAARTTSHGTVPDWTTARDLVEELTGDGYDPRKTGHRTALVAIAAILGGGNPRTILPSDFPEPVISRTMRGMAEKQIMVGGNTPAAWLDPEVGDLTFFIDVLRVDGVLASTQTQISA